MKRREFLALIGALIVPCSSPAEMPIEQPTIFEMVVNAEAARTLDIVIPSSILLSADEVIG